MIIFFLSDPKKTHLTLSYIPPFIVTITALSWIQMFNTNMNTDVPSSADPTCFAIENILFFSHLKQVYNEFSNVSCGFFKLPYDTFYPFPGWIKNRMFKFGIHICFNINARIATFCIGQPFCYRSLWQNEHLRQFCVK